MACFGGVNWIQLVCEISIVKFMKSPEAQPSEQRRKINEHLAKLQDIQFRLRDFVKAIEARGQQDRAEKLDLLVQQILEHYGDAEKYADSGLTDQEADSYIHGGNELIAMAEEEMKKP